MAMNAQTSAGQYEIDIEEIEYLRHGNKPFLARVFKPRGEGPFPALIEAHGGAWCEGDRKNNDAINEPVARAGVVVAALDFRAPPDATYPGSVADVNYGIRWLKWNAEQFNTRPEMVGAMGTSSGGHLAVLAAMKPHDSRYAAIPLPAGSQALDARVRYVVTLWPVICPLGRYRDRKARTAAENLHPTRTSAIAYQEKYWITEEAMGEGSPLLALERGDRMELPDILYLQNPTDALHPRFLLERFVQAFRKAGGYLELEWFEGEAYDLIRSAPSSPSAVKAVKKIVEFIQRNAQAGRPRAITA